MDIGMYLGPKLLTLQAGPKKSLTILKPTRIWVRANQKWARSPAYPLSKYGDPNPAQAHSRVITHHTWIRPYPRNLLAHPQKHPSIDRSPEPNSTELEHVERAIVASSLMDSTTKLIPETSDWALQL
ncbi:hypothetical protein FCV25MIE_16827 [Fagus crenata]